MPHSHRRRIGRAGSASPSAPLAPSRRRGRDEREPETPPATEGTLAGYRLLRRLAAGDRADVYLAVVADTGAAGEPVGGDVGAAVTTGAPLVVMRVYGADADDDAITTEIEAMDADPTGTLPRILDVATVPDRHACLVVERVSGRPLSEILIRGGLPPGRVVTALAPIVVVVRHLADRGLIHTRLDASDVLVDDTGRPRLLGLGALRRLDRLDSAADRVAVSRAGHAVLLRLIEDAAAATTDRAAFDPLLAFVRSAVDARPFRRVESEIERALFAVAPALPVHEADVRSASAGAPSRVTVVSDGTGSVDERGHADRDFAVEAPAGARLGRLAALAQLPPTAVDDLAAALDADPRMRAIRRASAWARRRRPALVTGGFVGAAALVALLTAVPPSSAEGRGEADDAATIQQRESEADGAGIEDPTDPSGAPTPGDVPQAEPPPVPDDPVTAAAALLEVRQTCLAAGDLECVLAVAQPGSPIATRDRATIDAAAAESDEPDLGSITLAADLGDAAVLTVPWADAEREPASLLMMRSEAGWRLRDWFD
jgi:hypothetical protein